MNFQRIHWSAYEKHETDTRKLFESLGFTDSLGNVRKFDGKVFWPKLQELGHDKVDIEQCKCRTEIFRDELGILK